MYKKVMVAIDGGLTSKYALEEAEHITNTYNAALCIIHAVSGNTEADKEAGVEILAQAKLQFNTLNVETRLLEVENEYGLKSIVDVIAAATFEWGADLLVVGTANRRGLERFVVGSVAEQLVAEINCSVLLVRPQES